MFDPQSQFPAHFALLLTQLLSGAYYVITKLALVRGIHPIVLGVYRDFVAALVLLPAACFIDRKNPLVLSFSVLFRLFLLGCTWIFGSQLLLFVGIYLTSAGFSAALQPCIPAFTAMLAIAFGIEKVNWCRRDGQAKLAGIVICCSGAAVMALYRGPGIVNVKGGLKGSVTSDFQTSSLLWKQGSSSQADALLSWRLGALCLIGNCICMAVTINIQAGLFKEFPFPLTVTAYSYVIGMVMMGISGVFLVGKKGAWNLSFDPTLFAILYNGLIASAFNFGVMTWCLKRIGPLVFASYIPVQSIVSVILASVFLHSETYLSSLIGASLIVVGLFFVSWARSLEYNSIKTDIESNDLQPKSIKALQGLQEPLIQK